MDSEDVLEALYPLLLRRSEPDYVRTDNGPEFIASSFRQRLIRAGIQPLRIFPSSFWENGHNERFNGTLRLEVLNVEWFATTRQVQVAINQWLRQYNHIRPHHALGMRPPVPETLLEKPQISGPAQGGQTVSKSVVSKHSMVEKGFVLVAFYIGQVDVTVFLVCRNCQFII
jgi:putative transposase